MRQEISSFPGGWLLWWWNQYWGSFWSYGNRGWVLNFLPLTDAFLLTQTWPCLIIGSNFDPWKFLGQRKRFVFDFFFEISKRIKKSSQHGRGAGGQKIGKTCRRFYGWLKRGMWKNNMKNFMSIIRSRTVV